MEKTKGYTEEGVLTALRRKSDIRVVGKQVQQLSGAKQPPKGDVGNGTKGKIDFLIRYCGYTHFYVDEFKHK